MYREYRCIQEYDWYLFFPHAYAYVYYVHMACMYYMYSAGHYCVGLSFILPDIDHDVHVLLYNLTHAVHGHVFNAYNNNYYM